MGLFVVPPIGGEKVRALGVEVAALSGPGDEGGIRSIVANKSRKRRIQEEAVENGIFPALPR